MSLLYELRTTQRGGREGRIDGKARQTVVSDGICRPRLGHFEQIRIRGARILRVLRGSVGPGGISRPLPLTPPPRQKSQNEEEIPRT